MMSGLTNVGAPAGQSQLVSYGGSTFLIQPAPDGTSAPLITAVTAPGAREEAGDPGLAGAMPAQGEVSPQHSLSYATRVSPATIQWLIANYETAEVYCYWMFNRDLTISLRACPCRGPRCITII